MASGEVEQRAKAAPRLTAKAAADPEIGISSGGGFPVQRDGRMIAIVAVSGGALSGVAELDEACAQIAVARLQRRAWGDDMPFGTAKVRGARVR